MAGCIGGGDDGDDDTGGDFDPDDVQTGGVLEAGWNVTSLELDPPYATATQEIYILANIFNGLVKVNEDLEIEGDLATDWEVNEDGTQYQFELREDVTFHNGEDFTAEDVQYSIGRTQEEEPPMAFALDAIEPAYEGGVEVIDDYTVELNLSNAFAPLLVYLTPEVGRAATVVNETAVEELGDDYSLTPVGTGPFEVVEHTSGSGLEFEAFDDYFEEDEEGNQLPYLDGVDIDFVEESSTRVSAMQAGDLEFISLVPAENADELDGTPDVDVLGEPDATFGAVFFNLADGPFTSEDARIGVARSIDRQRYVDETFFGYAQPGVGPVSPATEWAYREDKPDTLNHDPESGQELLEQEDIVGEEFELIVAEPEARGGQVLANILGDAGIDIELRQVDPSTYQDLVPAGDFNITLWGSSGDPDPDMTLYDQFGPPEQTTNWWGFEDEEVFDLLEEQRLEPDQDQRREIIHEIEDYLIENAICATLDHQEALSAKASHVMGYTQDIPMVRNFHTTWLSE